MANFGNDREALLMNNFFCNDALCTEGAQINKLTALVRNNIIVGSSSDELWMVDAFEPAGQMFDVNMQNNIVVVDDLLDPDNYPTFFETICSDCFEWSFSDTLFVSMNMNDYHLDTASVAEMKAIPVPGITDDLDGKLRDVIMPDIGCYEFQ